MNNKNNSGDILIGIIFLFIFALYSIINEPFLLSLMLPISLILIFIYVSGTNKRDTYFKSKRVLLGTTFGVGGITIVLFYLYDKDFLIFGFEKNSYISYAIFFLIISCFFSLYSKKFIPISFLDDDDRLVQETMYEDYDYKNLEQTFAYRGTKFIDKSGTKLVVDKIDQAKGQIKSTELTIQDLELVALNKNDELKFYYQKVIYDFHKILIEQKSKINNDKLLIIYGYNFTFVKDLKDINDLKEAFKEESFLYYKIFEFLEIDMRNKDINISLRFENIYKDNLMCLEFMLIAAILMVRQYMNFPVGDLMKYVVTKKDKNFMGCFSSLPADFNNINSTSVSASGIAYYFLFYKLHLDWFNSNLDSDVIKRWVNIPV